MNSIIDIKIQELESKDMQALKDGLDMMNRTQGDGLFDMNYLTRKLAHEDALVLGAFSNDELISIGCAEIVSDFSYYSPFEQEIAQRLKNHRVGSLCTLCVREEFQGKGVGQLVSKRRMEWLKSKECHFILAVSWISGLRHTSDRVLEKIGFQLIGKVDEFFKEGAIKNPFNCPGCKIQPCNCSAALYQYTF